MLSDSARYFIAHRNTKQSGASFLPGTSSTHVAQLPPRSAPVCTSKLEGSARCGMYQSGWHQRYASAECALETRLRRGAASTCREEGATRQRLQVGRARRQANSVSTESSDEHRPWPQRQVWASGRQPSIVVFRTIGSWARQVWASGRQPALLDCRLLAAGLGRFREV